MREGFFGFNVALRGLYTAQRSLDVVNHNISNVNTPGYSRQQAVQQADRPIALYDGTGMLGTGSITTEINRVRDEYLDYKYWSESVAQGEWDAKSTLLSDLEVTFNEPSDSGFNKILDEFYSSLHELGKDPDSEAVRALVREKGVTAAKYFNSLATHFEKLQSDINYSVDIKVSEVNSLAGQIVQLNKQIYTSELDGNTANDLRDQRGVLIDKLSRIVNIEVNEVVVSKRYDGREDKHMVITISGKPIVDHFDVSKLKVVKREDKLNEEDIENLFEVKWEDGNKLNIRGGELKGLIDVRDGNEGISNGTQVSPYYKGIPYYQRKLNEFVRKFAMSFNEGMIDSNQNGIIEASEDGTGHADGYGIDPDGEGGLQSPTGIRFFTMLGQDRKPIDTSAFLDGATEPDTIADRYKNMTAKNFSISKDVADNFNTIAASDKPGEVGNINNLSVLIKERHNPHMFVEGAPEDFMKALVTTIGIDKQQASRICDSQATILLQIENRRFSTSGVSLDEEMANMVRFQHAYNAAAKMITTMAEIYDILVNRIGV